MLFNKKENIIVAFMEEFDYLKYDICVEDISEINKKTKAEQIRINQKIAYIVNDLSEYVCNEFGDAQQCEVRFFTNKTDIAIGFILTPEQIAKNAMRDLNEILNEYFFERRKQN